MGYHQDFTTLCPWLDSASGSLWSQPRLGPSPSSQECGCVGVGVGETGSCHAGALPAEPFLGHADCGRCPTVTAAPDFLMPTLSLPAPGHLVMCFLSWAGRGLGPVSGASNPAFLGLSGSRCWKPGWEAPVSQRPPPAGPALPRPVFLLAFQSLLLPCPALPLASLGMLEHPVTSALRPAAPPEPSPTSNPCSDSVPAAACPPGWGARLGGWQPCSQGPEMTMTAPGEASLRFHAMSGIFHVAHPLPAPTPPSPAMGTVGTQISPGRPNSECRARGPLTGPTPSHTGPVLLCATLVTAQSPI